MIEKIFSSLCVCIDKRNIKDKTLNFKNENINSTKDIKDETFLFSSKMNYLKMWTNNSMYRKNQQSIITNIQKDNRNSLKNHLINVNNNKLISKTLSKESLKNNQKKYPKKSNDNNEIKENQIYNEFRLKIDELICDYLKQKSISESSDFSNFKDDNLNDNLNDSLNER